MKMESNKKENKNDKVTDLNKDLIESKYIFCKYYKINNLSAKSEEFIKAYIITNEDYNKIIQNSAPKNKIEVKIYSNKDDIIKLIKDKIKFVIVNEYFIQDFDKRVKFKNKKHVDIYTDKTIAIALLFYDKNQILELKYKDNLINNYAYDKNELIIKKLTLLYAFENEFQKTITNSIEDEYDMKDYYLVNKNIIEIFKDTYSYPKIKEILDKYNNNWSYKGYLKNIDSFIKNNDLKKIVIESSKENGESQLFDDEYSFNPNMKKYDIFQYPNDFIVIPKTLFDLFYDDFNNHKKAIEDYKFNVLIGDNTLFVQDSTNKNVFHTYKYNEKHDLEIICSFKYDNELLFYEEVENCIKGKGLEYYLFQRKLDIKNGLSNKILFEMNNGKSGECFIYKQIINEKSKIDLIEVDLVKNEKLINQYINMLNNIKNLESTNIKISTIKDIENKKSNLKKIKGFIVFEPIIKYILEGLLNYTQMKKLNSFPKNDNNYIQLKNKIIKKISENPIKKTHFEQVKALGEEDFQAFDGTEEGKPLI